jgi:hypothetical protein
MSALPHHPFLRQQIYVIITFDGHCTYLILLFVILFYFLLQQTSFSTRRQTFADTVDARRWIEIAYLVLVVHD